MDVRLRFASCMLPSYDVQQHFVNASLKHDPTSCVVRITVLNRTSSGGTKFKLGGVSFSCSPPLADHNAGSAHHHVQAGAGCK